VGRDLAVQPEVTPPRLKVRRDMSPRTLAILPLLLALNDGGDLTPSAATPLDRAHAGRSTGLSHDEVEGCRAPAPSSVQIAPAACVAEGRP
jgi:hypothetical protein